MDLLPLRPQPGSTLDPESAVGRQATSARARHELLDGNNLSLSDPRRMGKTVWLDMFCRDPGEGMTAVKVDFEGAGTREEFLLRTVDALRAHAGLPRQVMAKLRAMFDGVEAAVGPVAVKAGLRTRTPTELLGLTMDCVEHHADDGNVFVIAMDEVPIALHNVANNEGGAAAGELLQKLRELRQRGGPLRWIVSGSIGFHHVLRLCGATEGAVNDLINLPLGPLARSEAQVLAERLLVGIGRAPGAGTVDALLDDSDCIPFFIHALAHRLEDAGTGTVSARHVRDAFAAFADDRDESRAATHLVTRIDLYYGGDAAAAKAILDDVAIARMVEAERVGAEAKLLDLLIDDHYLAEQRGALSWRYDVLRRIWMRRRRLTE